jgi:hypothetical protein
MTREARVRPLVLLTLAAFIGAAGLIRWPFPENQDVIRILWRHQPHAVSVLRWRYALLWFTTPTLVLASLSAFTFIFLGRHRSGRVQPTLPPYPDPTKRTVLSLVIGEVHHPTQPVPVEYPRWLTVLERGLCTGIAIIGTIGSGKTSGCMYPYVDQLLAYGADDPARRLAGLVLEVKGEFCHQLRQIAKARGRRDDYLEVSIGGPYRYNPLHNDLPAYAQAYGIATLLNNLYGHSEEPFWQQAYTNLVKFLILLHQLVDGYVTLFDIYAAAINPEVLAEKVAQGRRQIDHLGHTVSVVVDEYLQAPGLHAKAWRYDPETRRVTTAATPEVLQLLEEHHIAGEFHGEPPSGVLPGEAWARETFGAVKRWYEDDWTRIEPKLRTSIVEGISVFLSLFDDNPAVKYTFCPPKACYDAIANASGRYGVPLPPMSDLVEAGRVCALNFPVVANPALARAVGTLMKQDFQRAVLARIPRIAQAPKEVWRHVFFLCDEYHAFATVGEEDPSGDEKFFALSRQARCIPIVATQSISSLRSALAGDAWRTLLQTFRTKIFLSLSDDFSAKVASELCGKTEQLKPQYTLSENGQDARVSMLTGRAAAHRSSISASKSFHLQRDWIFEPKIFTELKNAQAIVLAYDGVNPHPPTYCYLKPHYLNPNWTYFDQVNAGAL